MSDFMFDREEEQQNIRHRLSKGRPFLLYGPSGVGKTLLLRGVVKDFPSVLYCENSATTHTVFQNLARQLWRASNPRLMRAFTDERSMAAKSAVSLKAIVMDGLKAGRYAIVLDHIKRPSHCFAAVVRELIGWASTPVSAVARSCHMEDAGFLLPFYSDRSEKNELRNFDTGKAEQFALEMITRTGLSAPNLTDFIGKLLDFSAGNPGAIVSLIQMAKFPKYRSDEHIKITPLYIDFRMNRSPSR
jgi:ATPase family associated with various cellular activities (AAA)